MSEKIEWEDNGDYADTATAWHGDSEVELTANNHGFTLSSGSFEMSLDADSLELSKAMAEHFVSILDTVNRLARETINARKKGGDHGR